MIFNKFIVKAMTFRSPQKQGLHFPTVTENNMADAQMCETETLSSVYSSERSRATDFNKTYF